MDRALLQGLTVRLNAILTPARRNMNRWPEEKLQEELARAAALLDQARAEIDQGLKLAPDDGRLLLLSAKAMLLQKDPAGALAAAGKLEGKNLPPSQVGTIQGAALVALKQTDKAIGVLTEALKLNPTPMETYYFLGLAYQQKGQSLEAAQAFRTAFEHTGEGRSLADVAKGATAAAH